MIALAMFATPAAAAVAVRQSKSSVAVGGVAFADAPPAAAAVSPLEALLHRRAFPDVIISTMVMQDTGDDPQLAHKRRGYETFLRSARAATPDAVVLLIADDATWAALPPDLTLDGDGAAARVLRVAPAELMRDIAVPRAWRRQNIMLARYQWYTAALEWLRRRYDVNGELLTYAAAVSREAAPLSARGHDRRHPLQQPFVLLSDARDVLLQGDVFERARRVAALATTGLGGASLDGVGTQVRRRRPLRRVTPSLMEVLSRGSGVAADADTGGLPDWRPAVADAVAAAAHADCNTSHSRDAGRDTGDLPLPPLLVAEEPDEYPLAADATNMATLRRCFRGADIAATLGDGVPVICAGTTMGAFDAVVAYAHAMVALLPACLAVQRGIADQAVHNMALYSLGRAGGSGGGGGGGGGGGEGRGTAAAVTEAAGDGGEGNAAHEQAFAAFAATSLSLLHARVAAIAVSHDVGLVCTLGLVMMGRRSPVLEVRAGESPDAAVAFAPFAGARSPCALVHQYDRAAAPIAVAEAAHRRAGRGFEVCQAEEDEAGEVVPPVAAEGDGSGGREALPRRAACYSYEGIAARRPPAIRPL